MDCVVRVRSTQNPTVVVESFLSTHFAWPQIKNALLSDLGINPLEDIYFVLLDDGGKVAGPIIADDKRFWTIYNNKYVADSNMVFELNFRHHTLPDQLSASVVRPIADNNHSSISHNDIHAVTIKGDISAVKALVQEGLQVSARDDTSSTPLHYACAYGHFSIVEYLLTEKPLIKNYRDNKGRTPLLRAASAGHLDIVKYLISEKAFSFVVDEDGNSALHLAAINGHEDVVNWLLQNESVDAEMTNKSGLTYEQAAAQQRQQSIHSTSTPLYGKSSEVSEHTRPSPTIPWTQQASSTMHGVMSSIAVHSPIAPNRAPSNRGVSALEEDGPQSMMWCRLHGHVDSLYLPVSLTKCSWEQLCEKIVTAFSVVQDCALLDRAEGLSYSAIVNYAVLIEEDGDEGSGRIDDMRKFVKLYKKLYRPESSMVFEFHIDNNELARLLTRSVGSYSASTHITEELDTALNIRESAAEDRMDNAHQAISEVIGSGDDLDNFTPTTSSARQLSQVLQSATHHHTDNEELFLELELEDTIEQHPIDSSSHSSVVDTLNRSRGNSVHETQQVLTKEDELLLACRRGQYMTARTLISCGVSVNARDMDQMTPMHVAAECGLVNICELLVMAGCFKNNRDKRGKTPLLCAASAGHLNVVKYLISEKAFTFVVDEDGNSALHLAAINGHEDVVNWLTEFCDIDSDAVNASGQQYRELMPSRHEVIDLNATSHPTAPEGLVEMEGPAKRVIRPRDEVLHQHMSTTPSFPESYYKSTRPTNQKENAEGNNGFSSYRSGSRRVTAAAASSQPVVQKEEHFTARHTEAMVAACYSGDFAVAEKLLTQADPNGVHPSSLSALHLACHLGNADFAEALLNRGAFTHLRDRRGFTALHLACQGRHLKVIEALFAHKAQVLPDDQGLTPLHYAAISGDQDVVKILLASGGNIDDIDNTGNSAFHYIVESKHVELALWVAENYEVDVYALNMNGMSPMDIARHAGQVELLTTLTAIDKEKKSRIRRAEAGRKLIELCEQKQWPDAEDLLDRDVDTTLTNSQGQFAIHLCAAGGNVSCIKLLLSMGIDVNMADSSEARMTPIMYAVREKHPRVLEFLIEYDGDVNKEDSVGFTPLFYACDNSDTACAEILIRHGADPLYRDWKRNDTAMHVACRHDCVEMVKLLEDQCDMSVNSPDRNKSQHTALDVALLKNCVGIALYAKESWEGTRQKNSLVFVDALNRQEIDKCMEMTKLGVDPNFYLPESGEIVFHLACQIGNIHVVKALLEQGASLSLQGKDGMTAIHCASVRGQLEIIRWLKKCGCSLNEKSGVAGMTPLHFACFAGDQEVARWLVDRGANYVLYSGNMSTVLHYACASGNKMLVKWLLKEFNCPLDAVNQANERPIDFAVNEGKVELVTWLAREMKLSSGETAELKQRAETTHQFKVDCINAIQLRKAAAAGDVNGMRAVLEEGINVNSHTEDGTTALHLASANGQIEAIKFLLNQGASINCKKDDGMTPLHLVCRKGNFDAFDVLVDAGADVMCFDRDGSNILSMACQGPNMDLACHIVESYPQFNECRKNKKGLSPINMAAAAGHVELVLWFSQNLWITRHQQFLLAACERGDNRAAQNFISLGLDVNVTDDNGLTPLHLACLLSGTALVLKLLNAGANVTICDKSYRVPLHYAAGKGYVEIVKLLCDADSNVDRQDDLGMTPLLYACKNGHMLTAAYLLGQHADIMLTDNNKNTALHYACRSGDLPLVQWLYEGYHLSEETLNADKRSPMDVCREEGCTVLLSFFQKKRTVRSLEAKQRAEAQALVDAEKRQREIEQEIEMIEERARAQAANQAYVEKLQEEETVKRRAQKMLASATSSYLIDMAAAGSLEDVLELLACDTDPDSRNDSTEATALHMACRHGHAAIVNALLKAGANVNAVTIHNETPMLVAAEAGHWDCVMHLLSEGADPVIRNSSGDCPIELICDSCLCDLLQETIMTMNQSSGANFDPSIADDKGETLFHRVVRLKQVDMAKLMLQYKADVNCKNHDGQTPLMISCEAGDVHMVLTLLKANADAFTVDVYGRNSLMAAVLGGSREVVNILLKDKAAGTEEVDSQGYTALHYACEKGLDEIGRLLLNNGASLYAMNADCKTPLQLAESSKCFKLVKHIKMMQENLAEILEVCSTGDADWLKVMIAKGTDVSRTDGHLVSGLHVAAHQGRTAVLSVLVDKGMELNRVDDAGRTPLHYGCFGGKLDAIKLLVRAGADITKRSLVGRSCLHYACQSGSVEVVKWVLEEGQVSINCTSWDNSTPLHDAASSNHVQVVSHLIRAGASPHVCTVSGANLLHVACLNNALDVAKWLMDNCDIDIDAVDGSKQSSFFLACQEGHLDTMRWLYNAGANFLSVGGAVDALDTALHIASRAGHSHICEWLVERGLNVFLVNGQNDTSVDVAVSAGHHDLAAWLDKVGQDLQQTRVRDLVCVELDKALEGVNTELSFLLLDDIADAYFNNSDHLHVSGEFLLQRAAGVGAIDVVKALLKEGISVSAPSVQTKRTPLHYACARGHDGLASILIKHGANVMARDIMGLTPFDIATKEGYEDIVLIMKTHYPSIVATTAATASSSSSSIFKGVSSSGSAIAAPMHASSAQSEGESKSQNSSNSDTPSDDPEGGEQEQTIHRAVAAGRLDLVAKYLQEYAFDVNTIESRTGRTALHWACDLDKDEIAQFLMVHGASVNRLDDEGNTPLHLACRRRNQNLALALVRNKADLTIPDGNGSSALHLICSGGMLELLEDIIDLPRSILRNLNLDVVDTSGKNLLHVSVESQSLDMASLFIRQGVNINHVDNKKMTPLHYAVLAGQFDIAQSLLIKRADVNATDIQGRTAMSLAVVVTKDVNFARMLYSHGGDISFRDESKNTLLHIACRDGSVDLAKWLARSGADPNVENASGQSAVQLAHLRGADDLMEWLLAWILSVRLGRPVEEILAEAMGSAGVEKLSPNETDVPTAAGTVTPVSHDDGGWGLSETKRNLAGQSHYSGSSTGGRLEFEDYASTEMDSPSGDLHGVSIASSTQSTSTRARGGSSAEGGGMRRGGSKRQIAIL